MAKTSFWEAGIEPPRASLRVSSTCRQDLSSDTSAVVYASLS